MTSPSFPSLKEVVTDAGVELSSTTSDCSSVEGREIVVPELVASPTKVHLEPLDEEVSNAPDTCNRMSTQLARRLWTTRHTRRRHRLDLHPPEISLPEISRSPDHECRGRSRFRSPPMDWWELKRPYEVGELPVRPSPDAEIHTAMKGRVTRCQRMCSVSRPEPIPA